MLNFFFGGGGNNLIFKYLYLLCLWHLYLTIKIIKFNKTKCNENTLILTLCKGLPACWSPTPAKKRPNFCLSSFTLHTRSIVLKLDHKLCNKLNVLLKIKCTLLKKILIYLRLISKNFHLLNFFRLRGGAGRGEMTVCYWLIFICLRHLYLIIKTINFNKTC